MTIFFKYKNTFTEDLWAALEEASNKPVGAVMSTWTKQMGFPMVQVSIFLHYIKLLNKVCYSKFVFLALILFTLRVVTKLYCLHQNLLQTICHK
jgi:hypothetical protein